MLQHLLRLSPQAQNVTCLVLRRNLAATSALYAKGSDVHPIQKLYVDKIREYAKKSQAAGGGMVDADPTIQKELETESARLNKMYGGGDLSAFPDVKFNEIDFSETVAQK
ncbi:ATP synthase-coupling factor 6, mitochondrial-like [Amphiura filiformis]|uniref:ATP synthase-coupling factor 6, mitochondrial-like n=1 Tax=Amphiura filiformis TaxID=82378 RepID=UPI003B219539